MSRRRPLAAVPDRPTRVVLYVRVSALMGRGGDDFHSPDVQTSAMRRATTGMREVDVVQDIDVTGRHFVRDGIDRVREMAKAGQIDAIAVYDISRFGRDVLESLLVLRELAESGVTIISACEHIDTSTPAGEMMLINMLNLAQYRSREIGRAWSGAIARRAEQGRHHGRVPIGYERGEDGRLTPHPILGPVIAQVFRDYAAGATGRDVRRRIHSAGRLISASGLKNLLSSRTYRGVVHSRGQGGSVETPNAHEPLVDEETWDRVQARIAEARYIPNRLQSPAYSLSGLGRCGVCGGSTNAKTAPTGARIFCRSQADLTRPCTGCGHPLISLVEEAILGRVQQRIELLRGDVVARKAQLARSARAGADATALQREIDATRKAMARTTQRWAREQMDDRTYEDTMADLRRSEEALQEQLASARSVVEVADPEVVVSLGERLLRLWPDMDAQQRNRALKQVLVSFTLNASAYYRQPPSERLEVQWR